MLVYSAADFEDFLEPRPEMPRAHGARPRARGAAARRATLAVPPARHLRRDHRARAKRVRGGEPRRAARRPALVLSTTPRPSRRATSSASARSAAASRSSTAWRSRANTSSSATARRAAAQHAADPAHAGQRRAGRRRAPTRRASRATTPSFRSTGWSPGAPSAERSSTETHGSTAWRRCASGPSGSAWFSSEEGKKGALAPGQLADLAVLSADYFSMPDEEIKRLESVLTLVGGKPVYAAAEFACFAPPPLPVSPDWSPVAKFGGYAAPLSMSGCECSVF